MRYGNNDCADKNGIRDSIKSENKKITVVGPYAEQIAREYQKRHKVAKVAKVAKASGGIGAVGVALASIGAAPFSGGLSLAGLAASAALTVGTVTISAVELAIICGFTLGMYGLSKGYDVKYSPDGTVEIIKK